jgi:hypothetical protein
MPRVFPCVLLVSLTILSCRSADTGLGAFVPPDTVALAGMRMDQLRNTPTYQKLRLQHRFSELDDLKARTGFDPTRDVNELLVATNGKDAVTIARGQFHPTDMGAKKVAYKGYTLHVRGEGAYALIDSSTAVAGTEPAVRAAIDQYKSGARSATVSALLARGRAIAPQNQIWAVSDSPEAFTSLGQTGPGTGAGNAANVGKVFGQLERLSFAADLTRGLNAVATGDCKAEQDAKAIGDLLRGVVSLGKLSVPQGQTELLRIYDSVQVDQQQKVVKMVINVPPDLIDKLVQLLGSTRPKRL